jgi:hypothetical protein
MALSEDKLSFSWEGDRSGLGRVVGQAEVIQAASNRLNWR